MAIDPKQLAKENLPLVVAYSAALLAIVVYFLMVAPLAAGSGGGGGKSRGRRGRGKGRSKGKAGANSFGAAKKQVERIKKNIEKLAKKVDQKDLLTKKDKAVWDQFKAGLATKAKDLKGLYVEKDRALERWFKTFENLDMTAGKAPRYGDFNSEYKAQYKKLVAEYQDLVGAGKDLVLRSDEVGKDPENIIEAQKKFWFKKDLLSIMKKVGVQKLISDISIFPNIADTKSTTKKAPPYDTYTCEIKVLIAFTKVPVFVREVLASELTYRVEKLNIARPVFDHKLEKPCKLSINSSGKRRFFEKSIVVASFPDDKKYPGGQEEKLVPEPAIRLNMTVVGLDFRYIGEAKKGDAKKDEKGK